MPINEYEDLLTKKSDFGIAEEEAPTQEISNPYVDTLKEQKSLDEAMFEKARFTAQRRDSDKMAKAMDVAPKLGMDAGFVYENFDKIKQEMPVQGYNPYAELVTQYPKLTTMLKDENFATVVKHQIDNLKKLEDSEKEYGFSSTFARTLGQGAARIGAHVAASIPIMYDSYRVSRNKALEKVLGKKEEDFPSFLKLSKGKDIWDEKSVLSQAEYLLDEKARELGGKVFELNDDFLQQFADGDYKKAARTLIMQAANNAPNSLVAIGSVLTGQAALGFAGIGISTMAGKARELEKRSDVSEETRLLNAGLTGGVEASTEMLGALLPFGIAMKSANQIIGKQFGKEAAKAVSKEFFTTLLAAGTGGAVEEMAATLGEATVDYASVDDKAFQDIFKKTIASGALGAVSGVGMTGPAAIAGARMRSKSLMQAQSGYNFWNALNDPTNIEFKNKLPAQQQQALENITRDGPLEMAYIDKEAFVELFQKKGENAASVAARLGISKEFSEAMESGTEIKVKTADIASKLIGTEEHQLLSKHIKFDENGTTIAQEEAEQQRVEESTRELEAEMKAIEAEAEDVSDQIAIEGKEVKKLVRAQLINAGRSTGEATNGAKLYEAFFRVAARGDKLGRGPLDLYNKYNLKMQRMDDPSAVGVDEQSLNQGKIKTDTPEFKAWFGESKAVDESGKPLVVYHGTSQNIEEFNTSRMGESGAKHGEVYWATTSTEMADDFAEHSAEYNYLRGQSANYDLIEEKDAPLREREKSLILELQKKPAAKRKAAIEKELNDINEKRLDLRYTGQNILPVYVQARNPLVYDAGGKYLKEEQRNRILDRAKREGNDSVLFKNLVDSPRGGTEVPADVYAVFSPTQIKSVNNRGTFDPNDPRILYQTSTQAPTFYSNLIRTVEQKIQGSSATVEQVNAILKDVKTEEKKWMGIDTFLKGKTKVNKQELLDYLRANELQIEEVVKGEATVSGYAVQDKKGNVLANFESRSEASDYVRDLILNSDDNNISTNDYEILENVEGADFSGDTKFSTYQLPAGENYREVLFRLPEPQEEVKRVEDFKRKVKEANFKYKEALAKVSAATKKVIDEGGDWRNARETALEKGYITQEQLDEVESLKKESDAIASIESQSKIKTTEKYRSSHWEESNILAHTRLNDRVDADGKRVLFVEEIQSDWHQAGRKRGYQDPSENISDLRAKRKQIEDEMNAITESTRLLTNSLMDRAKKSGVDDYGAEYRRLTETDPEFNQKFDSNGERHSTLKVQFDDLTSRISLLQKGVPDAPFRKTWHEFVMKRLIREAAEKGYDKIAWTTGDQQAERYDLSKQVDSVGANKKKDGTFDIEVYKDGRLVIEKDSVKENALEELIGKDLATKIVKEEGRQEKSGFRVYEGIDLKVGGEGMKGFYDKILVDFANKFGKKYGARVESAKFPQETSASEDPNTVVIQQGRDGDRFSVVGDGGTIESFDTRAEAASFIKEKGYNEEGLTVHSLTITPQLRDAALNEGFSLFQNQGDPMGRIRFGKNGINIDMFKAANPTTPIHESGHFFLKVIKDMVKEGAASDKLIADYKAIWSWLGAEEGAVLTVPQEEKWAKGIEAYFFEGRAPSKELEGAFKYFKKWFQFLYQKLESIGVELSPEIRGVMDRLFAVETEVARANNNYENMFEDPSVRDALPEKLRERYDDLQVKQKEATEKILQKSIMKSQMEKSTEIYQQQRDAIKAELLAEIEKDEFQQALKQMLEGSGPFLDGTGLDREVIARLPKQIINKTDGIPAQVMAEMFGYPTKADFIIALEAGIAKRTTGLETEVDAEMQRLYPDNIFEIEQLALEAVHNDFKYKILQLEYEYLQENARGISNNLTRQVIQRAKSSDFIRERAENLIDEKNFKELAPNIYERAERKASQEAARAFLKKDFEAALVAKEKEILSHTMFKRAAEAKRFYEKKIRDTKKFAKADKDLAKSRDLDFVNAARAILGKYGLNRREEVAVDHLKKLSQDEFAKDTYAGLTAMLEPLYLKAKDYKEVSYKDFKELMDVVDTLWELSRSSKQITINGKKLDLEAVKAELVAQISVLLKDKGKEKFIKSADKFDRYKTLFLGAKASMKRIEAMVDAFDINFGGPFRTYIWEPISGAVTNYRLKKTEVFTQYKTLLEANKDRFSNESIEAPELINDNGQTHTFNTKSHLLMALLHTGNASNKSKLILGYKWGTKDSEGNVDTTAWDSFVNRMNKEGVLTKADYDLVQSIWDLMDSFKPLTQAAHKQMYGYYFSEITAESISTPYGEYRGGYIPAKADTHLVEDAKIREDVRAFEEANPTFAFPTTGRGATMKRNENYTVPLDLNMGQLGRHMDWALRFAYIEPSIKEVSRIVNDREFRANLKEVDSEIGTAALVPWLKRTASQQVVEPSKSGIGKTLDFITGFLKRRMSSQIMFLSIPNTLLQISGLPVALAIVKPSHLLAAHASYLSSPKKLAELIYSKSKWMNSFQGSNIYETLGQIEDIVVNPTVFESIENFSRSHTYVTQSFAQNLVNTIVWWGAYNQAVNDGMTENRAIEFADGAVRKTQGSVNAEDVSEFETGTETRRSFTQFTSYFNMTYNLMASEFYKVYKGVGLKKGAARLFYLTVFAYMMPATLEALLFRALAGKPLPDDDDEEFIPEMADIFIGSSVKKSIGMLPFVSGTVAAAYNTVFTKEKYDDRITLSPTYSAGESAIKTLNNGIRLLKDESVNARSATRDGLFTLGLITGLPTGALARPASYLIDVSEGKANPTGALDFTRGLISGKKGEN